MLARYAVAYLATGIVFAAIDFVWLSYSGATLYRPLIGELLADKPRLGPAVAFYLIYIAGIITFAVAPALKTGEWTTALVYGAAFGFFAYATYDLTSHAVLKVWALKITVLDMFWGTVLTGAAASAGYWITNATIGR